MTIAGRPYCSTNLDAQIPAIPACISSEAMTTSGGNSSPYISVRYLRDNSTAASVAERRSSFNLSRDLASASARTGSSQSKRSKDRLACAIRPAAFRRGPNFHPIASESISDSLIPACLHKALIPGRFDLRIASNPSRTRDLLSPFNGAKSQTRPRHTNSI